MQTYPTVEEANAAVARNKLNPSNDCDRIVRTAVPRIVQAIENAKPDDSVVGYSLYESERDMSLSVLPIYVSIDQCGKCLCGCIV